MALVIAPSSEIAVCVKAGPDRLVICLVAKDYLYFWKNLIATVRRQYQNFHPVEFHEFVAAAVSASSRAPLT